MSLYGQQPEASLLASFLPRLEHREFVDVGAERGAFVAEMLLAGSPEVHAIEPEPENVAVLRSTYVDDPRVVVHGIAASDMDRELDLHRSVTAGGVPLSFAHTVLDRPDTSEIGWAATVSVPARSLSSLVESGEIPARVGVVKIDTEGHDLAVVGGLGYLDCDVVMVEHWTDLPLSLGPCPWTSDEMVGALAGRGFSNFALLLHLGELVIVQWNDGHVPSGRVGNIVFIQDRVLDLLLPCVLDAASALAKRAAEAAVAQATLANALESSIVDLSAERDVQARAATERLARLDELTAQHEAGIGALERSLDVQKRAAAERLEAIKTMQSQHTESVEELTRQLEAIHASAEERLAALESLRVEYVRQIETSTERLGTIDALTAQLDALARELDLQASVADERLVTLEELERERDILAHAAEERLAQLEKLGRDHEEAVERLEKERDLLASISAERLAVIEALSEARGEWEGRPHGWR